MKKIYILLIIFFLLLTGAVSAQTTAPSGRSSLPSSGATQTLKFRIDNPLKGSGDLFELMTTIIKDILLPIASVLVVLAFIYSGFLYVKAQGNDKEIAKAHRALLYSAIGTAILLGAYAIMEVIKTTVNQIIQ